MSHSTPHRTIANKNDHHVTTVSSSDSTASDSTSPTTTLTTTPTPPIAGPASTPASPPIARSPQRLDIQGLRAVCMIQVLLYHAWTIGSPIGVDSFIMISAFLMTASFIRRSESGKTPFFIERWATTFKRLLPPLIVVVLATLWATVQFLPRTRWIEIFDQAFASLTYVQNWRLVEVAADYYAENSALSSPLQHLWSMSMQGQVFLLWPVIMTICVLLAKLFRQPVRRIAFLVFALITAASLWWLLNDAPTDGSVYFYTQARLWEFALGSTLAVATPWIKDLHFSSRVLSWLGLAVLVTYCLVSIGHYPGPMAAVPMVAVSLILIFPTGDDRWGASRFLSWRPFVTLGNISYAVYLIHWPVFVIFLNLVGAESLSLLNGFMLIMVSIFLAWGLTKAVDDPIRSWPWANAATGRKVVVALVSFSIGLGTVWFWDTRVNDRTENEAFAAAARITVNPATHPGSLALTESVTLPFTEDPIPKPTDPWAASLPDPCDDGYPEEFAVPKLGSCTQVGDSATAAVRILAVGSSKLTQFSPGLRQLAEDNNWYIQLSHQAACAWGLDDSLSAACRARNQAALDYLDEFKPDYVLLLSTVTTSGNPDESAVTGLKPLLAELAKRHVPAVGIRDTLRNTESMLECSLDNLSTSLTGGCVMFRPDYQADVNPVAALESKDFTTIDLTDQFCSGDLCPTIIGNIFVYVDTMHVSRQYVMSLTPTLGQRLVDAMSDLSGTTLELKDASDEDADGESEIVTQDDEESADTTTPKPAPGVVIH